MVQAAGSTLKVERHGVQFDSYSGAERMGLRCRYKSSANGVLLDIPNTAKKLLFAHDLALVEAAHPYVLLGLEAEGKASLDELHGFFK
jgi:hypothetical protein